MAESEPRISIVLPVYNGERHLHQAIASCLRQSHRNIELVVVDDCSTDSTPDIVKTFDDERLVYLRNECNQGLPRSLNIGFAKTSGEYLTWTSDDNEYAPTALEAMLRFLSESPGVDFVYADMTAHDEIACKTWLKTFPDEPVFERFNSVGACFLYTRAVYEQIGDYDPRLALVEDYDYWIRVWRRFGMKHLPDDLYFYRYHGNSLTATRSRQVRVVVSVLQYQHGLISLASLTDAFYEVVAEIVNEQAPSDALASLRDIMSRVRRISTALALRLVLVIPARWTFRKLRRLIGALA